MFAVKKNVGFVNREAPGLTLGGLKSIITPFKESKALDIIKKANDRRGKSTSNCLLH